MALYINGKEVLSSPQIEGTAKVWNSAHDAYASLDSGDDAVAGNKGLAFYTAADEDVEIINLTNTTGTPRIFWDESEDGFVTNKVWICSAGIQVGDDDAIIMGSGVDSAFKYETADTNAKMIHLALPHVDEDANNVAVLALIDRDLLNADLGAGGIDLSGITEPSLVVGDEDSDSYVRLSHSADDLAMLLSRTSTTPTATDQILTLQAYGKDGNASAADFRYGYTALVAANVTDTSESGTFAVYLADAGTADNLAFYVEGNGELFADLDGDSGSYLTNGVNLFDEFDDVEELRKFQLTVPTGLITEEQRLANRQRLRELGVVEPKKGGDMLKMQSMFRLVAGGIYQNRQLLENLIGRVEALECGV